jgi:hypothetical protein
MQISRAHNAQHACASSIRFCRYLMSKRHGSNYPVQTGHFNFNDKRSPAIPRIGRIRGAAMAPIPACCVASDCAGLPR